MLKKIAKWLIGEQYLYFYHEAKAGRLHHPCCDPISALVVTTLAVTGASVGTSMAQASSEEKKQRSLLDAQNAQAREAEDRARNAGATAEEDARRKMLAKAQGRTQTILTSPLGLSSDSLAVKKPTLLGGV